MIKILLGESKTLQFSVKHKTGCSFVIASATYKIIKDNKVKVSGNATVTASTDGYLLSIPFTPAERGYHVLDITYTVASEVRMARYKIDVD